MLSRPVVVEQYCAVISDRQPAAAIESIVSSTQLTSAGGTKALDRFKFIDIPLPSRPAFLSFNFDEVALENLLSSNSRR